jgi:outer membrane protein TolC
VKVRSEAAKLAVAELYFDALQSESRARAAESRLQQAQALRKQVEDAWESGTASRLDVARAVQRAEAEQIAVLAALRDRRTLATQLLRAIGLPQQAEVALAQVIAGEEEVTAGLRAEMAVLESRGRVLQEELKKAERERYPKVSAFGDFGALGSSFTTGVSTYAVGVNVSVPVWTSGRIESGIQAAKIRLEQWREEKRKLELQISQEEAAALVERDTARQMIDSARRGAEAAREAMEMARLRYGAGMTTNLDLVTAQSNLAESEEMEIQARYDRLRAEVRLARARGDVAAALVR